MLFNPRSWGALQRKKYQNPFPNMVDPNWSVASSFPAKKTGGIDWNWKDGIEALNELKQPEYPKLAASRSGGPRPRLPGYTQTNMGAYGGDLVEQQAAMAKARREEELQRRMKLMGGGY